MTTEVAPTLMQTSSNHHRSSTLPTNDLASGRTASHASTSSFVHVDIPRDKPANVIRNRPGLLRSQSAFNPRELLQTAGEEDKTAAHNTRNDTDSESEWQMRHGWDWSAEQLRELSSVSPPVKLIRRHTFVCQIVMLVIIVLGAWLTVGRTIFTITIRNVTRQVEIPHKVILS